MLILIPPHGIITGLNLTSEEAPQFGEPEKLHKLFSQTIATRTQAEWVAIFEPLDACVTPVLTKAQAASHPHNGASFMTNSHGLPEPVPAPRLSRTPAETKWRPSPTLIGQHTLEIMQKMGYTPEAIDKLTRDKVLMQATSTNTAKL